MIGIFNAVTDFFRLNYTNDSHKLTKRQRYIESYLSESTDLVDLERREKELEQKGFFRY